MRAETDPSKMVIQNGDGLSLIFSRDWGGIRVLLKVTEYAGCKIEGIGGFKIKIGKR